MMSGMQATCGCCPHMGRQMDSGWQAMNDCRLNET